MVEKEIVVNEDPSGKGATFPNRLTIPEQRYVITEEGKRGVWFLNMVYKPLLKGQRIVRFPLFLLKINISLFLPFNNFFDYSFFPNDSPLPILPE